MIRLQAKAEPRDDIDELKVAFFAGVPRYWFIDVVARGGTGVIFRAWDLEADEVIAIKVIRPTFPASDAQVQELAKRELHLNRRIKHPNVARVHDLGRSGSLYFLTMELVPGRDLETVVREEGRLPAARVVPILRQIALGAAAAHAQEIVHRDLKSSNVMADQYGAVTILDLGFATWTPDQPLTRSSEVFGSPFYVSPEQAAGLPADARSDLYSIGVIAFELLTGALPFRGATPSETLEKHAYEPLPPVLDEMPDVPAQLAAIVSRSLEKDPLRRFQSAKELERALRAVA